MKGLCDQMQDQITDQVLGLLGPQQQDMLLKHIKTCVACAAAMRETEEKHKLLSAMGSRFKADMPDRMDRCLSAFNQSDVRPRATLILTWRHIMAKPLSKIAVAAVIIIAAVLAVSFLDKSVTTAYAIEQTVEACSNLRFIHLKTETARTGSEGIDEMWAAFDAEGNLHRLRMNFPNSPDGPKVVVWQEGKAEVWFKAKNTVAVVLEENMLKKLKMSYQDLDPKLIGQQLCQMQANDEELIEIQQPPSEAEPIIIERTRKGFRTVYTVDPETKLLQQHEDFQLADGEYKFMGLTRYLDYNQPFDPGLFQLNPEPEAIRFDHTARDIGSAKGDMSDEESAVKLVRQFVEAAIAKDYAKASTFLFYIPAGWVEEQPYQGEQVVRLISIGKPELNAESGSVNVPCQVEVEKDGQTSVQSITFRVQQIYGQSERWKIFDFE